MRPMVSFFLTLIILAGAVIAINEVGSFLQTQMDVLKHDSQEPVLVPPEQIERFHFGYADLLASLFWLRSIQDLDFCGSHLEKNEYREIYKREMKMCQRGWIFKMLDSATRLQPRFRILYTRGAVYLSVLVNDLYGAAEIFERGVKALPSEWSVAYSAAYHFVVELEDYAKGADYMNQAVQKGAPEWLALSAARFYDASGRAEFGLRALAQFYTDPFEQWPEKARERWADLEKSAGKKAKPEDYRNSSQ